jgi:glycerol-3-phosphate dehydrogenase
MKREYMLRSLEIQKDPWDIVVIGGGATGLGIAVDASSRGFSTLLVEQYDFGKGTSGRSTKLVHGGVRYLAKGDIALVYEGLRERGLMLRNAPHLVRNQKFIIPVYTRWDVFLYTVGLKFYDLLAGGLSLGRSHFMSRKDTIKALPTLNRKGLKGGILYHDGQFDDTRMLVSLAQTCEDQGGTVLNYMKVTGLIKDKPDHSEHFKPGKLIGLKITDQESQSGYFVKAKSIINATGVFADEIMHLDEPDSKPMIRPSQGIHIVLERDFLESDYALMIPRTSDGRVMFAVPWHGRIVVGTTDTLVEKISAEPGALEEEIQFLLDTAGQYLDKKPIRQDIQSVFAGLRPLAAPHEGSKSTKDISRRHKLGVSASGLITVVGGKWTSYRKMAEDAVNKAIETFHLRTEKCKTRELKIHGYDNPVASGSKTFSAKEKDHSTTNNVYNPYGIFHTELEAIENENENYKGFISEKLQIKKSQVIWAVREEMARTVEDVLARRTRALFLDARESIRMAPETAGLMAAEMGCGDEWIQDQLRKYNESAGRYLV